MNKRSFTVAAPRLALSLLSVAAMEPIPLAPAVVVHPGSFVTAQTDKQKQCANTCRARYRDCRSKGQVPPATCQSVYQDCTRWHCSQSGW
jgi:hypothetical protein